MFKLIALYLLSSSLWAVSLKPMNIQPGLWSSETKMDTDGMMAQMLAKVPEDQREMVKKMMKQKMAKGLPVTKICFTKKMIENPQEVYEEQMKKNKGDCKFDVKESSSTKFRGTMSCKGQEFISDFTWAVISKRETRSVVNTTLNGKTQQSLTVTSKWLKAECEPKKSKS